MKNTITLSIPKPCHEKWENFDVTAHGGFCSSCQKEVVDFTKWSDDAIKDYFKNRSKGSTCGRFQAGQLRSYDLPVLPPVKAPVWVPISLLGFTLLLSTHETSGQAPRSSVTAVEQKMILGKVATPSADTIGTRLIRGKVLSASDHQSIPGANILLKGSSIGAISDAEGNFTLTVPRLSPTDKLVVTFIGFQTQEIDAYKEGDLVIELGEDTMRLGELVYMGGVCSSYRPWSPRGIWIRIKNLFR